MTVDDLIKFYKVKSDADLARKLKRPRSTISYWRSGGIPTSTQATFQVLTKGQVKADMQSKTA
ncbi:hypothetical protein I0P11_10760 [Acinetobacter baumannii]|jgi:hypothetical protein|uniref:hypothetical protein n=1 Tax=Acinetobacter calcoaceticus/baumannii complex TaxID=909768 RepID=UPI000E2AD977|nr:MULTISPECIES: hypothetical protein [Acinetobacter calcoaceticus/baumannii complex]AZC10108.1 hypothetical protein DKE47_013835 [Acinetobacter nosocomialis]EKV6544640.1 hypothetical protein [Acinetobacter baumannii]ELA7628146.1 hypothetical protein [Acinetobacter baumannii]ELB0407752.1 hypothetical protein [Acinetobacter baumannii]ELQ4938064.1 hypothetical protein [Acinetobacter baumannii]